MRRWLTVLALGLLWTQAASAQSRRLGEDYDPVQPAFQEIGYLFRGLREPQQEADELAALKSGALDVHREGGMNVDASCLGEVVHHKGLLTWRGLFSEPMWLERYEPEPPPLIFRDGCPCLEILNYLCFFDVLSPAKVGPEMGPWFMEPEPPPPFHRGKRG